VGVAVSRAGSDRAHAWQFGLRTFTAHIERGGLASRFPEKILSHTSESSNSAGTPTAGKATRAPDRAATDHCG
jgi:hypothetical protein